MEITIHNNGYIYTFDNTIFSYKLLANIGIKLKEVEKMINKIVAWVWLVWIIIAFFYIVSYPSESFLIQLIYVIGACYINIKYIESLKK